MGSFQHILNAVLWAAPPAILLAALLKGSEVLRNSRWFQAYQERHRESSAPPPAVRYLHK
jgi:hypothetical protein